MGRALLEPGCVYHIYNHAVGSDKLFLSVNNFSYFLKRYIFFISPIAETYAFCLLSNHIHFLVEIKEQIDIPTGSKYSDVQFVAKQFSNLFSSYTQAFNKRHRRFGNLFISNFQRIKIESDEYLTHAIKYINLNPVRHRIVEHPWQWEFSSYNGVCSKNQTFLAKEKVLRWFGNVEAFKRYHAE
jgi:putative transposase